MNNNINPFKSDLFEFIEDIIVLDEPILSHYKKGDKDYLLYLVDKLHDLDKYLLLEIQEIQLYEYLTAKKSLYHIISSNPNFIFQMSINYKGELIDYDVIQSPQIKEEYLPVEDSFIELDVIEDSIYHKLLKKYNDFTYIQKLKKDAFYIKFNPKSSKYGHTVGFKELSEQLFRNIATAYSEYTKFDFFNTFNNKITKASKLKSIFNNLKDDLDFRVVDAQISSFEVGLAIDTTMKNSIEDPEFRKWAKKVGEDFKQDVLELDDNQENLDNLLKFTPEQRKKIMNPIIEVFQNKNIDFQIKDNLKGKYKKIKMPNTEFIDKVLPKENILIEAMPEEYEIIHVTTLARKGIEPKSIRVDNNTLFTSTNNANIKITKADFEKHGYNIIENISVEVTISTERQGVVAFSAEFDNEKFKFTSTNDRLDDGLTEIIKKIYEYILNKST